MYYNILPYLLSNKVSAGNKAPLRIYNFFKKHIFENFFIEMHIKL